MSLRYKLAKDTFKGKKVPPKVQTNEDHISEDQRGNQAYVTQPGNRLLNLAKGARSAPAPAKKDDVPEEMSRRGMLGAFFGKYADERREELDEAKREKEKLKKQRSKLKKRTGPRKKKLKKSKVAVESKLDETASEADASPQPQGPKIGFFRRIWLAIKSWFANPVHSLFEEFEPKPEPVKAAKTRKAVSSSDSGSAPDTAVSGTSSEGIAEQTNRELLAELKQTSANPNLPGFDDDEEPESEVSRRNLLRQSVHFVATPALDTVQRKIDKVNDTVSKVTKRMPLIRPPGAISERQFLQACTRCDKCIHACPPDALKKAPKSFGLLVLGTPYIDAKKNPCVMCNDLPCISACPEGALLPVPSREEVSMGYAILDKEKCAAYGNMFCQQCVIDCPMPGAITQDAEQRPIIDKKHCTGCGVCVRSCNTVNIPVAIKIKPQMVIESQIRKKQLEKEKAEKLAEKKAKELEDMKQEILLQEAEENSKG